MTLALYCQDVYAGENKVSLWLFVKIHCHKNYDISNFIQMTLRTAVSLVRVTSVIVSGIYVYMYVTFPALNDNMTSKREKAKWKTIDSFFTKPVSTETKDSSDKIASTEEPISKESLPERIDDSEHASSVSTVSSKDSAPPYPDISSLQDSKLQMTDVKMQLLTANSKDVI